MTEWIIWGVLLVLQNASHTATSRARNSKGARGLWYNAIASTFSNGIWFASQFFIVNVLVGVSGKPVAFTGALMFYIVLTAFGSVAAQWYLMTAETKRGIER